MKKQMLFLNRLYSIYAFVVFCLLFLLLFPAFFICIQIPSWRSYGRKLNYYWAHAYFFLLAIRVNVHGKHHLKKGQQYLFVANHFSYLDIAVMGYIPRDAIFVGKSSLGKIPLFGYMFRKLHIDVDRGSIRSRYETIMRAKDALDLGSSLIIFPEGGIVTKNPPHMARFKDGAFRIAVEKQIPIIPITIPYNHIILPDDERLLLYHHKAAVIFHEPIAVAGKTLDDIDQLKEQAYEVIQNSLNKALKVKVYENR